MYSLLMPSIPVIGFLIHHDSGKDKAVLEDEQCEGLLLGKKIIICDNKGPFVNPKTCLCLFHFDLKLSKLSCSPLSESHKKTRNDSDSEQKLTMTKLEGNYIQK